MSSFGGGGTHEHWPNLVHVGSYVPSICSSLIIRLRCHPKPQFIDERRTFRETDQALNMQAPRAAMEAMRGATVCGYDGRSFGHNRIIPCRSLGSKGVVWWHFPKYFSQIFQRLSQRIWGNITREFWGGNRAADGLSQGGGRGRLPGSNRAGRGSIRQREWPAEALILPAK
jgi:hypothetical protein